MELIDVHFMCHLFFGYLLFLFLDLRPFQFPLLGTQKSGVVWTLVEIGSKKTFPYFPFSCQTNLVDFFLSIRASPYYINWKPFWLDQYFSRVSLMLDFLLSSYLLAFVFNSSTI